jgi:hypothetical protein
VTEEMEFYATSKNICGICCGIVLFGGAEVSIGSTNPNFYLTFSL